MKITSLFYAIKEKLAEQFHGNWVFNIVAEQFKQLAFINIGVIIFTSRGIIK